MRKLFLLVALLSVSVNLNAQNTENAVYQEIKAGDVLKIGQPDTPRYNHIDFPRPNFIIKKGGIANYKTVVGNKVIVTSVKEKKDGSLQVKLKRIDGRKFFNSHVAVTADLKKALATGELNVL